MIWTNPERFGLMRRLALRGVVASAEADRYLLNDLVAEGYAAEEDGLCYLTPTGEAEVARLYSGRLSGADLPAAEELLEDYSLLDAELKRVVQAWQLKPDGSTNQHDDEAYDRDVLVQLFRLDDEAQALLRGQTVGVAEVVGSYVDRLAAARRALEEGDSSRLAATDAGSYHAVWHELHEDLLRTLGRERDE